MITGKTRSGFAFEINEKIVQDWRVAEAMAQCSAEDTTEEQKLVGTVKLIKLILGSQENALLETIEDENGIAATQDVIDNVSDILDAISKSGDKGKN